MMGGAERFGLAPSPLYCLKCVNIEAFIGSKMVVYIYFRILWPCGWPYEWYCGYIVGCIATIGVVLLVVVWPCGWSKELTLVVR